MGEYWIALSEVLGRGSAKLPAVLTRFGSPKALFEASSEEIRQSGIFSEKEIKIISKRTLEKGARVLEKCKRIGCAVITPDMPEYPNRLRVIPDLPCVLYVRGWLPALDNEVAITIVGPREASRKGIKAAASLAARLTVSGCTIITGAARGVDKAALDGTLAARGKPISILPCGVDVDYPYDTLELRQEILRLGGCVISECPPGAGYSRGAFHTRNRILSALSLATVIIEAGEKSGALITAGCAAAQGKDVFVIPGEIGDPACVGSNLLLRDGARPLLTASDILLEYADTYPHKLNLIEAKNPLPDEVLHRLKAVLGSAPSAPNPVGAATPIAKVEPFTPPKKDTSPLSVSAKKVFEAFDQRRLSPDGLADRSGLAVGDVLSALIELEIMGFVHSLPGGRFEIAD